VTKARASHGFQIEQKWNMSRVDVTDVAPTRHANWEVFDEIVYGIALFHAKLIRRVHGHAPNKKPQPVWSGLRPTF